MVSRISRCATKDFSGTWSNIESDNVLFLTVNQRQKTEEIRYLISEKNSKKARNFVPLTPQSKIYCGLKNLKVNMTLSTIILLVEILYGPKLLGMKKGKTTTNIFWVLKNPDIGKTVYESCLANMGKK